MPEDGGIDVSTFTPEQQAALQSQIGSQADDGGVDPVETMDAAQLAELSVQTKGQFDPIAWADENQDKAFEPATLQKLSDAREIITSRGLGGFVLSDIGAVQSVKEGKPIEAAVKVVKPVAETVGNIAKWFGNTIIANPANVVMAGANELFGGDPGLTNELYKQAAKGSGETVAGVESAMFGLAHTGKKIAGLAAGPLDEEGKKQKFLSDLGLHQQQKKIAVGQGEFAQAEGTSAEDMAKIGVVLDPEVIAERASGDPFAFYAFGKGFQAITPVGKVLATIPGVAQLGAAARGLSSRGLTWAAETGVDLTGKAITKAGQAAGLAGKAAPITGAVVGLVKGGPVGGIAGGTTGKIAARGLAEAAKALKTSGTAISEFSTRLAAEAGPVGSYTQLARDVIQSVPGVVGAVGKGVGIDLGFAAAVSETPQETEAMATFGTTFGALHGIAGAGRRIVQGQALGARPWGTTEKTKPYGNTSSLDALHASAEQSRAPAEVLRADAIRAFAANLPGGVEAYLMPSTKAFESVLVDDYAMKNGVAPTGKALANIKSNAGQRGMFSAEMRDDAGQQRKVIILNEVDAAPHESMHAIQDVLGETSNQVVDALVRETYKGEWETIGEQYARRLAPGDARPWRDVISERTNFPNADVYLARELAAENFDTAFKNKGGDFGRGNTLPEKLARIAARTAVFLGGDPFVGAQTQGLRVQPKAGVIEAVKEQAELAKITPPVITPSAPAAPFTPVIVPRAPTPAPAKPTVATPATSAVTGVSADAKAAQAWAAGKNDPRLVNIVNSIVANQVKSGPGEAAPVRLKYLSVAGEEGSTRTPRRSEQEAAYLAEALGAMSTETRALVDKTHAHVRFDPVKKGNEYQSIGYSLEKLVENAQRTARWLAGNETARTISPYEVDPTTGSFTSDAWKQLVSDIQTYTENQQAGGTGAGKPLALPADAAKLGVSVPALQAAKLTPLEQGKADFINTLMGFKLPETTRVSRAGGTPGNIVGQEISRANEQPFIQPRVSAPAIERAGGKEFPGFPGRTIQEVNPLRRQLEAAGFPVGELIEVVERVNLKSLESVTAAPEVAFRAGVTDTIRAGFLPPAEKPRWLVKGQKGGLKAQAEFEGADMGEARRKAESQGYRVATVERTNPIELRTQFLPAEVEAKQVEELDQKGLQAWSSAQVGGFTSTAHRVGREATSQEFTDSLSASAARFKKKASDAIANDDFNSAMVNSTKAQFFREAWEAAAGVGSAGEFLKQRDATYKAPFPESPKTQFSPELIKELDEIKSGKNFGQTFNQDGSVWSSPKDAKLDIVTLASRNLPREQLTPESFQESIAPYSELLKKPGVVAGVFAFEKEGVPFVSIDINATVPQEFRKNSVDFARKNNQISIWDAVNAEEIKTGGAGETVLTSVNEMTEAVDRLASGKSVDFPMEAKSQFSPKAEEDLYAKYNEAYDKAVAKRKAGSKTGLTGWITPDNKLVPLSSNYHEQYLAENSASLNKKFGTKFRDVADVEERQQALDKGFVRMRMQGGTLHVESGQAGWTKAARDKVFETVADNIDNIDQIQVSLLDKNGIVKRQGSERLMDYETDAEKLDNLPLISEGRTQFAPAESENLPGMEVGREFNRAAINQMNRVELKAHFPEAIVPRSADEKINSNIVGSPLAKQEGGREAGVEAFANTLADFYRSIADQPEVKAGAEWYSKFTPMLKKEFGKDAPIFAELLAATSPQTDPTVNFGYAFDAYEGFKAGKYDKQIAKFNEGLQRLEDGSLEKIYDRDARAGKVNNPPESPSDSTYLAHWIAKHNLVPRSSSDKLFGTHSIRVLQVLARKWISMNAGPKTSNFVQNLLGTGSGATVDLWADRLLRRIGYSGFKDRWRILPENATGVSDADFAFSQEAFQSAADKLGMKASALQGALWFAEKRLWSDNGWGRLNLGDYRNEMKKIPLLRQGIKQREEAVRLGQKAGSAEQEALNLGLTIEPRNAKLKP